VPRAPKILKAALMLRRYILINFQAEKLRSQAANVSGKTMGIFNNLPIS